MHLKNLLGRVTETIMAFVNIVLPGEIPDFTFVYLFGASLYALSKKDGGIKPIVMGNTKTPRNLGRYEACRKRRDIRLIQLGFGKPDGCEAAVHVTYSYKN